MLARCNRLATQTFPLLRATRRPTTAARTWHPRVPQRRNFFSRSKSSFAQGAESDGGGATVRGAVAASGARENDGWEHLEGLVKELERTVGAPRFEIDGARDVSVLRGPVEFYAALKEKILGAKRRIFLSTLYIGKTEHELITTIRTALQKNAELKISFLTDALRGTREAPEPTTASLLVPLVQEFGPERVQIRMYHTPNLTGLRKKVIPKRINEGWGLQHMKLYGIDDEIILSGANLSNDYFTNRQDRYHVFSSKELTEYYERIHVAVSSISFDIEPSHPAANNAKDAGYTMSWPTSNTGPSPLDNPKGYIAHAATLLGPIITSQTAHPPISEKANTLVYPIFSLPPLLPNPPTSAPTPSLSSSTELPALTTLLTHLPPKTHILFTAGYFNPTPPLITLLLSTRAQHLTVLAASPYANGFYGSPGISGLLPPAYTLLCKRFLRRVGEMPDGERNGVRLCEWRRGTVGESGGWTFHAKGLWVTVPVGAEANGEREGEAKSQEVDGAQGPSLNIIGSSNYTARAYSLDLEANALVLTRDPVLQKRLREEEEWLLDDADEVTLEGEYSRPERRVGLKVRIAMWITSVVGGAL